jgi:hypothetical protein
MKNTGKSLFASLVAIALSAAPVANAALINVNFNGFTGGNPGPTTQVESTLVGPGGGLGTSWNQYADEDSSGVMVDSTGAATTVTVATNFSEGRYDGTGAILTMLRATLTDFAKGATGRTITISGLDAGSLYNIWLVSYRDQGSAAERIVGTWTTANTTSSAPTQLIDNRVGQNNTTFVDGYNYVLFESVEASVGGQIVFSGTGARIVDGFDADYRLGLNGLQIELIPEPSSALLGGLGLLALLRRRRNA